MDNDQKARPAATRQADVPALNEQGDVQAARERHAMEQAYFNDLYLLAPTAYFVIARATTVLQVNLAGAEMLGIARANPGVYRLRSFVAESFLPEFDEFILRAAASQTLEQFSATIMSLRAGKGIPVTMFASADEHVDGCRVMIHPAEGKLAALERSEARFRRIVHHAEEGIWEIDAHARTSFVNPKMAAMLGCSIEEMLGQPVLAFMDEEGKAIMERNVGRRRQGIAERHEFKFIKKNGQELWTSLATNPVFDDNGQYAGALALVTDITEKKLSAERIWHQANFDDLTGLPNRHMFIDRLTQECKKADRGDHLLALLFIDLDHFKDVNDRLGHAQGDLLLVEAAQRISACVRATDTLARLGGDEFTVILAGLEQLGSIERVAQSLVTSLAAPFVLQQETVRVSASIGIALYPPDGKTVEQLLAHADQAMYEGKNAGRNRYAFFTHELEEAAQQRRDIADDLRAAIACEQFELHYQPIIALDGGSIDKAEALLRWRHPRRGMLTPAQFMPFAESSGLIVEIGDWVFRQAARQARQWQQMFNVPFQINVNKSPVQFRRDPDLYPGWLDYLSELGLPSHSVVVEITEAVLLEGSSQVLEQLHQFHKMGLQVALDDFGTGHASLAQLNKFDIDYLKIDQSFVSRLDTSADDRALCEGIILMAHKLGMKVVAEGVETQSQRAMLLDAGCDYAQGYVFSHPLPVKEFETLVQSLSRP